MKNCDKDGDGLIKEREYAAPRTNRLDSNSLPPMKKAEFEPPVVNRLACRALKVVIATIRHLTTTRKLFVKRTRFVALSEPVKDT